MPGHVLSGVPRVPSPSLPSFRQMRYSRMSLSSLLPLHPEAAVRHPDLGGSRRPHPLRQPSPQRWLSRTRTRLCCRHCTCTDRATHFPHTTHTTPRPWYGSTHWPATNGTRSHNPPRPLHISTSRAATNTCCTLGSPCTCHATGYPRLAWYVLLCTFCTRNSESIAAGAVSSAVLPTVLVAQPAGASAAAAPPAGLAAPPAALVGGCVLTLLVYDRTIEGAFGDDKMRPSVPLRLCIFVRGPRHCELK